MDRSWPRKLRIPGTYVSNHWHRCRRIYSHTCVHPLMISRIVNHTARTLWCLPLGNRNNSATQCLCSTHPSLQHVPWPARAACIIAISAPPVRTHTHGRSWAQTWPLSPVPSMIQAHTGANNLSQRNFLPRKCGCNPCSGPTRSKVPHSRVGYHRKLSSPPRLAPPAPVCHLAPDTHMHPCRARHTISAPGRRGR